MSTEALPQPLAVRAVVAIAREWVELHARQLPGFAGAYLWGGITALPADAPFALYRDVDIVVVLSAGANDETREVLYRGLMLEVILKDLDAHRDAEYVGRGVGGAHRARRAPGRAGRGRRRRPRRPAPRVRSPPWLTGWRSAAKPDLIAVAVAVGDLAHAVRVGLALHGLKSARG